MTAPVAQSADRTGSEGNRGVPASQSLMQGTFLALQSVLTLASCGAVAIASGLSGASRAQAELVLFPELIVGGLLSGAAMVNCVIGAVRGHRCGAVPWGFYSVSALAIVQPVLVIGVGIWYLAG